MKDSRLNKIGRYLSYVLRHKPEEIGIKLDSCGWVGVIDLLEASEKYSFPFLLEELYEAVEKDDKQRFSLKSNKSFIRANQGHSIQVNLDLEPQKPPELLYHGTKVESIPFIKKDGLQKMSRQFVHLSCDTVTAINIGKRRKGASSLVTVYSLDMFNDGYTFYLSANNVWLVDNVPVKYLKLDEQV